MRDSRWTEKPSRTAAKLRFLPVFNAFQKLLLQSYLTQRDLLRHVSLAQFICLQRTVPLCTLWLHVLRSPVSPQQLSPGTASLRFLCHHPALTLQLEAQGHPKSTHLFQGAQAQPGIRQRANTLAALEPLWKGLCVALSHPTSTSTSTRRLSWETPRSQSASP